VSSADHSYVAQTANALRRVQAVCAVWVPALPHAGLPSWPGAAVDRDELGGDVSGVRGGQERDDPGDLGVPARPVCVAATSAARRSPVRVSRKNSVSAT
jgi:hypothetical protein